MNIQYVEGPRGPVGKDGKDGRDGRPGPPGIMGSAGQPGRDGREGPQGEKGIQGNIGNTGARGYIGIQGEKGIQGKIGNTGPIGESGIYITRAEITNKKFTLYYSDNTKQIVDGDDLQGHIGEKGIQGDIGEKGSKGPTGPKGKIGSSANSSNLKFTYKNNPNYDEFSIIGNTVDSLSEIIINDESITKNLFEIINVNDTIYIRNLDNVENYGFYNVEFNNITNIGLNFINYGKSLNFIENQIYEISFTQKGKEGYKGEKGEKGFKGSDGFYVNNDLSLNDFLSIKGEFPS